MTVMLHCKSCGEEHESPFHVGGQSFRVDLLKGVPFACPATGKVHEYAETDMTWRADDLPTRARGRRPSGGKVDTLAIRVAETEERTQLAAAACVACIAEVVRGLPDRLPTVTKEGNAELHRCVSEYARALRALGMTPGGVLARTRRLVSDVTEQNRAAVAVLMQPITGWAIEAYYT